MVDGTSEIILCNYGCGQEAKYRFKNGKWCCSRNQSLCMQVKKKLISTKNNKSEKEKEKIREKFRGKNNPMFGKPCYWKGKVGPNKGKKRTDESKIKQSKTMKISQLGVKNNNWKGGYSIKNIAIYDQYYSLVLQDSRKNQNDNKILEIKCAYCGRWFIPRLIDVIERIRSLENFGDTRIYCSGKCKISCPIYRKVKYPKDQKPGTSREVQPELRQLRFKFDNYTCQKCNKHQDELKVSLHCHHLEGIRWEPLESADIDKVITICKDCHIKIHKQNDCKYDDLKCK